MDAGTLELVELDETILDSDCKCGFGHAGLTTCGPCTQLVVARAIACSGYRLVCQSVVDYYARAVADPAAICGRCQEQCATHWRILPA